jgi:hypothetical protein
VVAAGGAPESGEVPQALVERVRQTEGRDRRLAARVLGEVVAVGSAPESGEVPQALVKHVRQTEGLDRRRAVKILGEVVTVTAALLSVDSFHPLINGIDKLNNRVAEDTFKQLADIVAERPDIRTRLREVVADVLDTDSAGASAAMLPVLAETDVLTVEKLRELLAEGLDSPDGDSSRVLSPYLDAPDPGRRHVLTALGVAISKADAARYPSVRRQLQEFLDGSQDIPTATRLAAMDVLTHLEGTRQT